MDTISNKGTGAGGANTNYVNGKIRKMKLIF